MTNINISGAPTLIYSPSLAGTPHVYVQNLGPATVYLGSAGVTVSGGLPLAVNQSIDLSVATTALYAVSGYTPTATTTTTSAVVASGSAVSTGITSGTGTANGQYVVIGAGTTAETTTISSGGGTTTVVLAKLLDDHNTGVPFTVITPQPSTITVVAGTS
jgi:hypothetical protein